MNDPLAKASANAPPIIGSGCTRRYDPAHLTAELGTDFPKAETLWKQVRTAAEAAAEKPASTAPDVD